MAPSRETIYRVVSDGSVFFVRANSFTEAEKKFIAWDGEGDTPAAACIEEITYSGDLIIDGTKREQ